MSLSLAVDGGDVTIAVSDTLLKPVPSGDISMGCFHIVWVISCAGSCQPCNRTLRTNSRVACSSYIYFMHVSTYPCFYPSDDLSIDIFRHYIVIVMHVR